MKSASRSGMPCSKINHLIVGGLLIISCCCAAGPARADSYTTGWYRELQLSIAGVDNVSHAWVAADRKPDTVGTVSFGLGHASMIGHAAKLILSGYLHYGNYAKTADLGNFSASMAARYIFQFTPGFHHAWYDTDLTVTHLSHHGSTDRNGYLIEALASVNRRLSGRLTARLGYRFHGFEASHRSGEGAPFQVSRRSIFVGVDYSVAEQAWLYGRYSFARGTFTSSASGKRYPASLGYDASSRDPAFEQCTAAGCGVWWAYRYRGNMNAVKLGVAFRLGGVNYDLSGRYAEIRSDAGRSYRVRYLLLGAAWDF